MLVAVLVAEIAFAATILLRSSSPVGVSIVEVSGRTVELVSMGGEQTDPLLARVRADLGGATAAVERFWGADWAREGTPAFTVVATATPEQFAAEAHLPADHRSADLAAVSVADAVDPSRGTATGQRIVMAPGATGMSDGALRLVLTHELFHLAARGDTATDAPRWLAEGTADYVARRPAPLPPGAAAATGLPTDADLDATGPLRSAGYDRAWWFARFVADDFGPGGLLRLYRRACGPGHPDLAAAVGQALGTDLAGLQDRWAQWLVRNTRGGEPR